MKVILSSDLQGHGKRGDIVDVNDNYARNYLLPRKLAVEATKAVINEYNQKLEKERRALKEEKDQAVELARVLSATVMPVKVKCGDGRLYGCVTSQDISKGLAELGLVVDKKKIVIKEPIKTLGNFEVEARIYKDVTAKITIKVIPE
jgi:large subunit ribosomal protein L9